MSSKEAKEAFVTGLTGSPISRVFLALSVTISCYWLFKTIKSRLRLTGFAFEYLFFVIPFIISTTLLSSYNVFLICSQIGLVMLISTFPKIPIVKSIDTRHESYVVATRSSLQIMTFIAILAVDFHVFPRSLAKTETFGVSLMDAGVGGFICSSGLVAGPRMRGSQNSLYKTMKLVLPALVLGVGRGFLTKAVDYQLHVSEYGIHWNFFITLGLLPILVSFQSLLLPAVSYLHLGLLVGFSYQYFLNNGLEIYIMTAERVDLISMNREGLCSLIGTLRGLLLLGFYSLFLLAAHIGTVLLSEKSTSRTKFTTLMSYLLGFSALFYGMTEGMGWQVSRRLANFPFVIVCLLFCLYLLSGFFIVDTYFVKSQTAPVLFQAVNRNQLAVFLIANLLTGCVNLVCDTMSYSDLAAFIVLCVYMLLVTLVAVGLDYYDITIKL